MSGIEVNAAVDIADEGVVGPAVPQARDHIEELARPLVAFAMLHVILKAEIQRGIGIGCGDEIPAGAAAADVVERREFARDVIGLIEGGRCGGDKSDPLGHRCERR